MERQPDNEGGGTNCKEGRRGGGTGLRLGGEELENNQICKRRERKNHSQERSKNTPRPEKRRRLGRRYSVWIP